jgi:hypothetical protein
VRPPSFDVLTCGVPAIKGVTACHEASAAARERPSGTGSVTPGVSRGDSGELTVRPVTVATVVGFRFDLAFRFAGLWREVGTSGYSVVLRPP